MSDPKPSEATEQVCGYPSQWGAGEPALCDLPAGHDGFHRAYRRNGSRVEVLGYGPLSERAS